jgi:NAD(P)-dependent dehydrogenase (short-subunit alcohol dehydrogenase family)
MYSNIDLSDKIIVITGATSGIGLATAMKLAAANAQVLGVGRSGERCREAEEKIRKAYPKAKISYLVADLSTMKQVRALSEDIKKKVKEWGKEAIDGLINNAGTVSSWYVQTQEGFEMQFAVNYLAPFLLSHELLELLKKAEEGKIINISSGSHYRTKMNWEDIFLRKNYSLLRAYKQCKLANVIFSFELNRRLGSGSNVKAYAVDPGLVNTEIGLKDTTGIEKWIWKIRKNKGTLPEVPAEGLLFLCSTPIKKLSDGVYWKGFSSLKPSRYSQNEEAGRKLWEISEKLCGVKSDNYF